MKSIVSYFDSATKWLRSKIRPETRRKILTLLIGVVGMIAFGVSAYYAGKAMERALDKGLPLALPH
jgi:hypothetical protein